MKSHPHTLANCTIILERRTVFGEQVANVEAELRAMLDGICASVQDFNYDLKVTFSCNPIECPLDDPIAVTTVKNVECITGRKPVVQTQRFWTDCALLAEAGIPTVLYGVAGEGLHAKTKFAIVESVQAVAEVLSAIALEFSK